MKTLSDLREARHLTQSRAAGVMGIHVVHLCNIENGKVRRPRRATLEKIADFYDITLSDVMDCIHAASADAQPAVQQPAAVSFDSRSGDDEGAAAS